MAFYEVTFEKEKYVSPETYMRVFRIGEAGLMAKNSFKRIFSSTMVGPLTQEEIAEFEKHGIIKYDVDARIEAFTDKIESAHDIIYTTLATSSPGVLEYRGKQYVLLADIMLSAKYRLLDRMAAVRVRGRRGIYVCLGNRDTSIGHDVPVIISLS